MANAPDPRGMIPIIQALAPKYGIDPDIAIKVAQSEGLNQFTSGIKGENSYGAFQLNTQGGLGNEFQKATGLDPSDPKNEPATVDYALKYASQHGWGAFHGAKNRYGYGPWVGINGTPTPQGASAPPIAGPQQPQVAQQPGQPLNLAPQQTAQPQPQQVAQAQVPVPAYMPPQEQVPQMAPALNAPNPIQQYLRMAQMRQAFQKIPVPAGFNGFKYS